MKKNDFKKLRLSRETLRNLSDSEAQKVAGGSKFSCPSGCGDVGICGITPTGAPTSDDSC